MHSYQEIKSQDDMNILLDSIAGFHDSMTKEIHIANRGSVQPDKSMNMSHRFDAQVLIQSQWKPFAIEMLFLGVEDLKLSGPAEYWGASGSVVITPAPVEKTRITMSFDSAFQVVCEHVLFRVRENWLGKAAFLKSEVPSIDMVSACRIQNDWRQCSSCSDAWELSHAEEISYCPGCGRLTQLELTEDE